MDSRHPHRTRALAPLAIAAALLTPFLTAPPASAHHASHPAPTPHDLATGLISPLTAAIDSDGTAYVTQNFAGQLVKIRPGKSPKVLYAAEGGNEVGAVSVRNGRIVFSETASDENGPTDSWIKTLTGSGKVRTLAHVRAYEERTNPDAGITYGIPDLPESCAAQWPSDQFGPPSYTGLPDSHPYATLQKRDGSILIADAGMNAVLSLSPRGRLRTVAVTPAVPVPISAELAAGMGLPDCVVGHTYYGESVPTDVAVGRFGMIYVTTEGGGLGEQMPLGAVHAITPWGSVHEVTDGLFAPVGIAASPRGDLYVSQLFGGSIVKIKRWSHTATPFAEVNMPAAVEWSRNRLYATVDALVGPSEEDPTAAPGGRLVRF